jgi:hypothetical protein
VMQRGRGGKDLLLVVAASRHLVLCNTTTLPSLSKSKSKSKSILFIFSFIPVLL